MEEIDQNESIECRLCQENLDLDDLIHACNCQVNF